MVTAVTPVLIAKVQVAKEKVRAANRFDRRTQEHVGSQLPRASGTISTNGMAQRKLRSITSSHSMFVR